MALGESKTLATLDLSTSGVFQTKHVQWLGKAVAFNKYKKGVLKDIGFATCFANNNDLVVFYQNMQVSLKDHELWYGESMKADKMA